MPRWYFSRPFWLYWTVAGRGARDGRINHPKEGIAQQVRPEIGQLDLVEALLREIEIKLMARSEDAVPLATRLQVDTSDYDSAVHMLESVMHARRMPLDALPADARRELVKIMVYLIGQYGKSKQDESILLTHYEAELIAIAEERIEALRDRWESRRNSIKAKAEQEQHKLDRAAHDFGELEKQHQKKENKQPHPLIGRWFYRAILIGLVLAEYWINQLAFQLWFQNGSLALYVSAALPAIAIPFFGHVIGTQVRYWQGNRELGKKVRWQSVLIIIGSLVVALITASSLVWFRSRFGEFINRQPIDWRDALSILGLNITALCAGIAAAYIAHDVDSDLENICKGKKRLLKELHRIWDRHTQLASEFDTLRGTCIAEVGKIRADTEAKIYEYRDYNTRYRKDGTAPEVFKTEIGERFFKARDFSHELSLAPLPLAFLYGTEAEDARRPDGDISRIISGDLVPGVEDRSGAPPSGSDGPDDEPARPQVIEMGRPPAAGAA